MKWRYHYHLRQRSFLEFGVILIEVLFMSEPFATGASFLSETVEEISGSLGICFFFAIWLIFSLEKYLNKLSLPFSLLMPCQAQEEFKKYIA